MSIRTAGVLSLILLAAAAPQKNEGNNLAAPVLGACAAFAADGASAGATFTATEATLEIKDPAGKVARLALPLPSLTQISKGSRFPISFTCNVFFNRAGDLVAVGIAGDPDPIYVGVADLKSVKWIGNWKVGLDDGFVTPKLAGFLEETNSLVIDGDTPTGGDRGSYWGLLNTGVFSANGDRLVASRKDRYDGDGARYHRFADAANNRLWVSHCVAVGAPRSQQPLCPITATELTGDFAATSEFDTSIGDVRRFQQWNYPSTLAATGPDIAILGDGNTIWRVDMRAKAIQHFDLPGIRFPHFQEIYAAALSPDAEVIAVALQRSRWELSFSANDDVFEGTDVAVVDVNRLQLLGTAWYGNSTYTFALAIDHRQEKTTILAFRNGQWERRELNAPARQ